MWTPETKRRFMDGELALWSASGGPPSRLYLVTQGFLWVVCLDAKLVPHWVQHFAAAECEKQLPTAWSLRDGLLPIGEVPEGLGARLREAAVRVEALRLRYEAGDAWIPQGGAFVGTHPVLGSLYVNPTSRGISSRPHPFGELFAWVWANPEGLPGPLSEEARAGVNAVLDPLVALIEGARREGKAIALVPGATQLLFPFGERFLWLQGVDEAAVERLLFNPHASALPLDKALDRLSYGGPFALADVPEALRAALPRLAEESQRTKTAMVDRYIAMLRAGGSISGGPTTDQSWTIRYAGEGYVSEGYAPTDDGGYERTSTPISEQSVREMLGSYRMFGLSELREG